LGFLVIWNTALMALYLNGGKKEKVGKHRSRHRQTAGVTNSVGCVRAARSSQYGSWGVTGCDSSRMFLGQVWIESVGDVLCPCGFPYNITRAILWRAEPAGRVVGLLVIFFFFYWRRGPTRAKAFSWGF